MKRKLYLIGAAFSLFISFQSGWAAFASSSDPDVTISIQPGSFHLSVFGDLVSGVELEGLGTYSLQPKLGYWNGTQGGDYMSFFDASSVDGFRIQMFLGGDFVYDGDDPAQDDLPPSSFKIFAEWDEVVGVAEPPEKALDDLTKTLSINSGQSCVSATPSEYTFNNDFVNGDFGREFSVTPFDYIESVVSCVNTGVINLGRFELDMGVPSPGTYSASLYIMMVDGT